MIAESQRVTCYLQNSFSLVPQNMWTSWMKLLSTRQWTIN